MSRDKGFPMFLNRPRDGEDQCPLTKRNAAFIYLNNSCGSFHSVFHLVVFALHLLTTNIDLNVATFLQSPIGWCVKNSFNIMGGQKVGL